MRRRCRHRDGFGLIPDRQRDVQLQRGVGIDGQSGPLLRLESIQEKSNVVAANRQLGKCVDALAIGKGREVRSDPCIPRSVL